MLEILGAGDAKYIKHSRCMYNQILNEKWQLETKLQELKIGNYGRIYLQVEIAKLQEMMIRIDENIFIVKMGVNTKCQKWTKNGSISGIKKETII